MTSNDHPSYEFWVTTDGDFLLIKGVFGALYSWTFDLEDLTVTPDDPEAKNIFRTRPDGGL